MIHWPDRDTLHVTMPESFKRAYGNKITLILDCFEVFIERPKNFLSRALCWSSYKHHLTAKTAVAIAPQGAVTFMTDSWGGRTDDKHLMENCEFLNKISPGDVILADRGFTIEDAVRISGASINIPAFTKGNFFIMGVKN